MSPAAELYLEAFTKAAREAAARAELAGVKPEGVETTTIAGSDGTTKLWLEEGVSDAIEHPQHVTILVETSDTKTFKGKRYTVERDKPKTLGRDPQRLKK